MGLAFNFFKHSFLPKFRQFYALFKYNIGLQKKSISLNYFENY